MNCFRLAAALGVLSMPLACAAADDVTPTMPAVSAPPPAEAAAPPRYRFRLPDDTVAFHGVVSFDDAGLGAGQILYAGGPVGLLAGVVTHALISNARRDRQREEIKATADLVLEPYADAVAHFRQQDFLERSFAVMTTTGDKLIEPGGAVSGDAWLVEYAPVFLMNQDRRALVLDNVVSIRRAAAPGEAGYRNTIRVVSLPRPADDVDAYWGFDHSANLQAESARLLALSFDVALAEARRTPSPSGSAPIQRTLRYRLGADERMERAELLVQSCERVVMRTLRGWVLSVPAAKAPATDGDGRPCAAAPG